MQDLIHPKSQWIYFLVAHIAVEEIYNLMSILFTMNNITYPHSFWVDKFFSLSYWQTKTKYSSITI
jgi:hypothetical protein